MIDQVIARAEARIAASAGELVALSDWMAANPEPGYQEHGAVARLTAALRDGGYAVRSGVAGLATAFHARPAPRPGPRVGLIAEYDALPDVGHGCGHNIIASATLGAALGVAAVAADLPGSVEIFGTPAEESAVPDAGGKIAMLAAGAFAGLDAALMIHPWTDDRLAAEHTLVAHGIAIEFFGRSAHAAATPHEGINALDALLLCFQAVGLLRQQMPADCRIHGIITHGGAAPNVIPDYAACRFRVRAPQAAAARALVERLVACAEGGARAAGARLAWREDVRPYLDYRPNGPLGAVLRRQLAAIGRPTPEPRPGLSFGSTDFGNVSQVVPAAFVFLGMCDAAAGWHTRDVAAATVAPRGHAAIIDGARVLARGAIEALLQPEVLVQARAALDAEAVQPR